MPQIAEIIQAAAPKESIVSVDGVEVRYFDAGRDVAGRMPLVMVHGTGGSTEGHFGYLFPMMATRQRVISVDLACPQIADGKLDTDQLVRQVIAVAAQALPGQRFSLLGYSLGAVVAALAAASYPALIENLVLIAGWMKTDTQQRLRNRVWRTLRQENSAAIRDYMTFGAFSGPFLAAKTLDEMVAGAALLKIDDFVDLQMDLNARIDISELVPEIRATTLIVGCTYDQMVPLHHSKALFGAIEDARYAEIAAGHAVVFERPAELFQRIDNFTKAPSTHAAGSILPAAQP